MKTLRTTPFPSMVFFFCTRQNHFKGRMSWALTSSFVMNHLPPPSWQSQKCHFSSFFLLTKIFITQGASPGSITPVENWSLMPMTRVVQLFPRFTLNACVIVIDTASQAICVNQRQIDRQCQRPRQQIYFSLVTVKNRLHKWFNMSCILQPRRTICPASLPGQGHFQGMWSMKKKYLEIMEDPEWIALDK